jgi:hypothetical protein
VNRITPPTRDGESSTYDIDPDSFKRGAPGVWYVSKGDKNAKLNLTLSFQNGQNAKLTAKGKFNIYKPSISSLVGSTNVQVVLDTSSGVYLKLGDLNGVKAMSWDLYVDLSLDFPGTLSYLQLINRDASWSLGYDFTGDYWLDNKDPYPAYGPYYVGQFESFDMGFGDDPGVKVTSANSHLSVKDSFETYVRFQPDGIGNIPITIGRVDWRWQGAAAKNNGAWALTSSGITGPDLDKGDDSFPEWLDVYQK